MLTVALLSDNESVDEKKALLRDLRHLQIGVIDLGVWDELETCSPKTLAARLAGAFTQKQADCGVGLSVSGNRLQMHANKYPFITAIPCISEPEAIEDINNIEANAIDIDSRLRPGQIRSIAESFLIVFDARRTIREL